jgi:GNAT superfamily N-acetyltransferase
LKDFYDSTILSELATSTLNGSFAGLTLSDPDKLHQGVISYLKQRANFFSLENFGFPYHARMGIEGTTAQQFVDTIIRSQEGRISAIAGIRFIGLDPEKPFVDILPFSKAPSLANSLPDLFRIALKHYEVFSPAVRLTLSTLAHQLLSSHFTLQADMRTLVAKVGSTNELPEFLQFWQNCDDMAAFYHSYQEEFERDLTKRPYLRPHRQMVDLKEFKCGLDENLLGFIGCVFGRPIGFVLIEPSEVLGLKGFIVREIFVFENFRSQGYGKLLFDYAVTIARTKKLDEFVFAPIFDLNSKSLRAAAHAGFSEFIADYWTET